MIPTVPQWYQVDAEKIKAEARTIHRRSSISFCTRSTTPRVKACFWLSDIK